MRQPDRSYSLKGINLIHKSIVYARLMRPANILTAMADILAGFAASGLGAYLFQGTNPEAATPLFWLLASTMGLYGGGIVLNDAFDASIDKTERPERPIPSGKASIRGAVLMGCTLLIFGISTAFKVSSMSGGIALMIALLAVSYNGITKFHPIIGPLNMGLCRGGNLLLGISAMPIMVKELWFLSIIPIIYISAVTMVSQGEVYGGNKIKLFQALFLYTIVIALIQSLNYLSYFKLIDSLPFLVGFACIIFLYLIKAIRQPTPQTIKKAVRSGVLALVIMDASIAAGFAGWTYGLGILLLLPVSLWLARFFAVT